MKRSAPFGSMIHFYRRLYSEYGETPAGVGWDELRSTRNYAAVAEVFGYERGPFSVYEVGCGFGAMYPFLSRHFPKVQYAGCDLIPEAVNAARSRFPGVPFELRDITETAPEPVDYVVAAGAFNSSGGLPSEEWWQTVSAVISAMYGFARKGIAISFLSDRVDWRRELGAYHDPVRAYRFAEEQLSCFVELRSGYYPWEFSLLVYRAPRELAFGPPPVEWPPANRERTDDRAW